ncbi:MAG: DUF563 domain-containing protein [Alphaproteobacteria bacterium]
MPLRFQGDDAWPESARGELFGLEPNRPRAWISHGSEAHDFGPAVDRSASCGLELGHFPELLAQTAYRTDPTRFVAIPECFALPGSGIAFGRTGALYDPATQAARWLSPKLANIAEFAQSESSCVARGSVLKTATIYRGCYLLLQHSGYRNFGHWMMDCLPGAYVLADEIRAGRLRVLCAPLAPWHRQTLAAIGLPAECVVECGTGMVRADRLIVPSLLGMGGFAHPSNLLAECYGAIRRRHEAVPQAPERLYVSRDDIASSRHMRNEAQLIDELTRRGFTVIRPAGMPIADQIRAFAAAKIIVGPHGSGMFNAVYAAPGARVIEISPAIANPRLWIARLCGLMGHRYAGVVVAVAEHDREERRLGDVIRRNLNFRYDADIAAVVRAIETIG